MAVSAGDKVVRGSDLTIVGNLIKAALDAKATVDSFTVSESAVDGGLNVLTITLTDGSEIEITTRNGRQGNSGYSGTANELEVVNNVVDGGTTAALSAEMGKYLYDRDVFLTESEYEALAIKDPDIIYHVYEDEEEE